MNDSDAAAFASLFADAVKKCFSHTLENPLSETESKLFSNKVLEHTGLIIGWKSLKNYSFFMMNPAGKQENPSVATLDTLARYVLHAPYTNEINRKDHESHFPYWFQYKNQFHQPIKNAGSEKKPWLRILLWSILGFLVLIIMILRLFRDGSEQFTDDFHILAEDSLTAHGWIVQGKDSIYWPQRGKRPGALTLFTLLGDNWPDTTVAPGIRNLLLRKIAGDCFTAEVHLEDFFPKQNWQQAGILLLEDTNFMGKSARLSLAYNDFFGGYTKNPEIIIQAITSLGDNFSKPEEIAHIPVFSLDPGQEKLITGNLKKSALRIEKHGKKFRFLYACGPTEIFAFKEAVTQELEMNPKYIGIFALKGFVENSDNVPVAFSFFQLMSNPCSE